MQRAWAEGRMTQTQTEQETKHCLRFTCVTLFTVANYLSVPIVLVAGSSKVATTVGPVWTGTRTTLATGSFAQNRVPIVPIGTPTEVTEA